MKKNLKTCIEQIRFEEPYPILDMNDYEMIQSNGLIPDLKHKKSAHMTARWEWKQASAARILLGDPDLSHYRYLTFSLFAIQGEGCAFRIRFENDAQNSGERGYFAVLPVCRNGWNDYRLELPFLQSAGAAQGWEHIRSIVLESVAEGLSESSETVCCLDNFYGWTESAPQSYVRMPELKGAALFSKSSAYAVIDRKRLPIAPDADPEARPFEDSGILWLPMAPIAAVIGHKAVVDNKANTLSFNYRRKQYAFDGASARYTVNGESQQLPFKPVVRAGTLFFPSGYLAEFFHWRQCFTDPTGLILISNRKNAFDSKRDAWILSNLNAEITFVHPTGETILEDLRRKISNPDKGRLLLLPEEWMAKRKAAKYDPTLGQLLEALKTAYGAKSDEYASAPVFEEGIPADENLQEAFQKAAARAQSFAALFRLTGEKHYAERCALECEALAKPADWNAEASMPQAAAVGLAVTLAYDWCHSVWSEGRKALIERALLRYLMRPGVDCYNGKGQMWRSGSPESAEINCALTASALALANIYPETALKLLRHSLRNVLPCFDAYSPDGGYPEGVDAWERATSSLVLLISMLQSACGKDYGLASAVGFGATARFALQTETANGSWNFHGGSAKKVNTATFGWFSRQYGNPAYGQLRQKDLAEGKKIANLLDVIYYEPISETDSHFPLDAVYRKAGLVIFRSQWSNGGNVLALHGGSNREHGNVRDAGSFLLEMGGQRFFAETNGILPSSADGTGKNTILFASSDNGVFDQSQNAVAEIIEARSTRSCAYAVVDMTSTNGAILRGKRGILLSENRSLAVIQDELTFSRSVNAVWSAYTPAKIVSASARTLVLELNGVRLLCKLSGAGTGRFAVTPVENTNLTRVSVEISAVEKLRMAVAFQVLSDGESRSKKLYELRPMSTWNE